MRSGDPPGAWWDDVLWPALTGIVVATALCAAYVALGLLVVLAVFVVVGLALIPVAIDVGSSLGRARRHTLLVVVPSCSLALEVLLGLTSAIGAWALLVLALVGLTARPVRRPLLAPVRRAAATARTRREFDRIVAGELSSTMSPGDS